MSTAILVGLGWFAVVLFGVLMFMIGASLGHRRGEEDANADSSTTLRRDRR